MGDEFERTARDFAKTFAADVASVIEKRAPLGEDPFEVVSAALITAFAMGLARLKMDLREEMGLRDG